ncbi:hypothetical protein LTR37_012146 [Vermiconidia calcicola]|uniref:Uncharacterized protein n=1 Tax=Vermiconidia calcicola TaxID=1690605 RepID=A0ACC3N0E7_9PEZI|nr:hypothetical protein LTR37_012146 [Vermiconidia calcicola]
MHLEQKQLESKNQELAAAYREKAKKQQQLHSLYQKLKNQQLEAGMEVAADYDADHVLQNAATGAFNVPNPRNGQPLRSRAESNGSGGNGARRVKPNKWNGHPQNNRPGFQSSHSAPVPMTPSGHRTQLPPPLYGHRGVDNAVGGENLRQGTPYRQTLNVLYPNVYGNSNNPGYGGMSAGMKVGRAHNGPISHGGIGAGRPHNVNGLHVR